MAISRALMTRVASGELPDTLRISRPAASVAFGKRDVIGVGYRDAVAAARAEGYAAVERVAGGRASVFHDGTIHIGHSVRHAQPRVEVTRRFERTADLLTGAVRSLGVDAHVGEVEGEYCPGEHSVNARHEAKLAGLGQRVIQGGAHVGAVVVVDGAERIRTVLVPVYDALDLNWRPETAGSLAAEDPTITWERARAALEAEYSSAYDVEPAELDDQTLALAERLAPEHAGSGS